MCGISGILGFPKNFKVDEDILVRMRDSLRHRGPDDSGIYVNKNVGLAHRRLTIIDLSTGQQPICNEDEKIWLTYNGEIYNYKDLTSYLLNRGHKFKTRTDTECIVHLYEELGVNLFDKLDGMFSFGLWDEKSNLLLLGRDRLGIKPLYYYLDGDSIIFASEIKSILANPNVIKEINYSSMIDYFIYGYVPSPKTIYKNIFKLPPGHYLVAKDGKVRISQFWNLQHNISSNQSESYYSSKLAALLESSVNKRLMSDVPIGALLSGGIDSSTVVALMSKKMEEPVKTFFIDFEESNFSEANKARQIADIYGTEHHEFTVKSDTLNILPSLVSQYDEPFADYSAIPTFFVSKMASTKVKVCLSGDGGDESFSGYNHYLGAKILGSKWIPHSVRKGLVNPLYNLYPSNAVGHNFLDKLRRPRLDLWIRSRTLFSKESLGKNLKSPFSNFLSKYDPYLNSYKYFSQCQSSNFIEKIQYVDTKSYLPDDILTKVDIASMAHSLEVRVPLLDYKLVEFAATIPNNLKLKGIDKKYILKKAVRNLLPKDILRQKKRGFNIPISEWLSSDISNYAEQTLMKNNSPIKNFVKKDYIEKLLSINSKKSRGTGNELWNLLFFNEWHRQNF